MKYIPMLVYLYAHVETSYQCIASRKDDHHIS